MALTKIPSNRQKTLVVLSVWLVCVLGCPYSHYHYHCPVDSNVLQALELEGCCPSNYVVEDAYRGHLLLTQITCPHNLVCVRYARQDKTIVFTTTPYTKHPHLESHVPDVSECSRRVDEDCKDSWNCSVYWKYTSSKRDHVKPESHCDLRKLGLGSLVNVTKNKDFGRICKMDLTVGLIKLTTPPFEKGAHETVEMFRCLEMIGDGHNDTMLLLQDGSSKLITMRYNKEEKRFHLQNSINDRSKPQDPYHHHQQHHHFKNCLHKDLAIFESGNTTELEIKIDVVRFGKTSVAEYPLIPPHPTTLSTTTPTPSSKTCSIFQTFEEGKDMCQTSWHKLITTIVIIFLLILLTILLLFLIHFFRKREKNYARCKSSSNDNQAYKCYVAHVN